MASFLRSRRTRLLQLAAGALLLVVLTGCLPAGQQSVYDAMNADRNRNGRSSLANHGTLNAKAQAWAT
ncbi:hypothetical protein BH24ACT4_BH24ACT4_03800 [soil metagenome]